MSLPPGSGLGAPVVPGKVSGNPRATRAASRPKAWASSASPSQPTASTGRTGCGSTSWRARIAAALRRRGDFGVLYATGNPDHVFLNQAEGEGCITKPYLARNVVSALKVVSERMSNLPLSALPKGFRLLGPTSARQAH